MPKSNYQYKKRQKEIAKKKKKELKLQRKLDQKPDTDEIISESANIDISDSLNGHES